MATQWNYFNQFDDISNAYLPSQGEGDTMATQIVTAVSKLVYKYYNDGDVYDNTGWLQGWANDLSSYANWLYKYCDRDTQLILEGIRKCYTEDEYTDLLAELTDKLFEKGLLSEMDERPKQGSIYNCDGPFEFIEYSDDDDWDEDEDWDEDYDDDDYYDGYDEDWDDE